MATTKERIGNEATRFKPGSLWTGNRRGPKPKVTLVEPPPPKTPADIKQLARDKSEAALNALEEIMNNDKAPAAARLSAANAILDRGYGKPQQVIEATVTGFEAMSTDDLIGYLTQTLPKLVDGTVIEGEIVEPGNDDDEDPDEGE